MKIHELIEELRQFNQEAYVFVDGQHIKSILPVGTIANCPEKDKTECSVVVILSKKEQC